MLVGGGWLVALVIVIVNRGTFAAKMHDSLRVDRVALLLSYEISRSRFMLPLRTLLYPSHLHDTMHTRISNPKP